MRTDDLIKEIEKLDLTQKLSLVENIWNSIASSNSELPMPAWQKEELDHRYAEYKAGKQALYTWETVHKELRKKYE